MTAAALSPYRVKAFNTAKASENKIHDDAVARRFGFGGGLVPGVDVYAYMVHQPVARWGRAWLERGTAECRFQKPVYDGDIATVTAAETAEGLDLGVESRGEICATGNASLSDRPPPEPEPFDEPPLPPADRPPAGETPLAVGTLLGIRPLPITRELVEQCVSDLRETEMLYLKEGLAHPVIIARTGNWALNHNVVLGPWMHVGSKLQHFAAARIGDELSVRARIIGNYEHKGHRFVDADVLVLANRATPVAVLPTLRSGCRDSSLLPKPPAALTPSRYVQYPVRIGVSFGMGYVSYTELRQNLKKHLDSVCESRAPLVVTRQSGEPVVMLSLAEYESLQETLHLLRDPANADRLLRSIRAAEQGKLAEHDVTPRRLVEHNITPANEAPVE